MRTLILAFAFSTLALAGCGKKQETGNSNALDQAVTAQDFVTNDVTAIDAATGADANMAADVDINLVENADGDGNGTRPAGTTARRTPRATPAGNDSNSAEPAEGQAPAQEPLENAN